MSRKLGAIILIMIIIVGLLSGCSKSTKSNAVEEKEDYVPVEVKTATTGAIENNVKLNGKVVANEEISIIPKVSGIVTNVNVKLGDKVKEGSVLFTIEQEDLLRNVDQGANAINIANQGVKQAENALNTAKLNYELNKEKIENAQINLDRTRKLYEEGLVPKSQLEQAELAASEKNLELSRTQVEQAEIAYEQALNQLRQAEISYEQTASSFNNTVVKAPKSGVVSTLNVKEGQIIANGQVAATIVDMEKVYIEINVVEDMVNRLKVGEKVEISIPSAFNEHITSTISYISPTADAISQLYPVKIYIENPDERIKPGMNGEVMLGLDKVDEAIVVDGDAILDKDDEKIVFIVEEDKAVERIVSIGLDTGDYIEIKDGIKEGDRVIVQGQHYVKNGEKVKVVRGE